MMPTERPKEVYLLFLNVNPGVWQLSKGSLAPSPQTFLKILSFKELESSKPLYQSVGLSNSQ